MSSKTLAPYWNTIYQMQYRMALEKKKIQEDEEKEKEWENPIDPAATSDERDKEQLLRQYREAKRRKNNLTEEDKTEKPTK